MGAERGCEGSSGLEGWGHWKLRSRQVLRDQEAWGGQQKLPSRGGTRAEEKMSHQGAEV